MAGSPLASLQAVAVKITTFAIAAAGDESNSGRLVVTTVCAYVAAR